MMVLKSAKTVTGYSLSKLELVVFWRQTVARAGEVCDFTHLSSALSTANQVRFFSDVTTNGALLNRAALEKLVAAGVSLIQIFGWAKRVHDQHESR